jgi:ABC-type antimicrobial peptide transport system ATPase subunit
MIAMALAAGPRLLVADEPTTALDVTVQKEILELLRRLQEEMGLALLFITHDLGVVAQVARHLAVMYAGRIVELGPVDDVLRRPRHPYTEGLLRASPQLGRRGLTPIPGTVPPLDALPPGLRAALVPTGRIMLSRRAGVAPGRPHAGRDAFWCRSRDRSEPGRSALSPRTARCKPGVAVLAARCNNEKE